MIANSAAKPILISGNMSIGACCACEFTDGEGNLVKHIEHRTLYYCQRDGCHSLCCKEHLMSCGFCYGCCAEEHGLGEGH